MNRSLSLGPIVLALALAGCEVEKTQEGEAPQVSVQGGQLPKYDVDAPDVNVSTEQREVTVPDVDVAVSEQQRTVTVPKVEVEKPKERG